MLEESKNSVQYHSMDGVNNRFIHGHSSNGINSGANDTSKNDDDAHNGAYNNTNGSTSIDVNSNHSSDHDHDYDHDHHNHPLEITIDEAVDKISTGRFQHQILFAAGTCFMADSMEIMLLSFLSLVLKREWNWDDDGDQSAETKVATITSCMFVGALLGTTILGPLGDRIGRRPVLFWAASIISVFGILTAFCNNFYTLVIVRFIVGFGIGGITVPFDILAEFIPGDKRGKYLLLIEYFWTAGSLLVPVVGYLTLEILGSWRLFVAACALPCVFSLVAGYVYVPESPRWLILQGRNEEALDILREAAVLNGKDPHLLFPQNCRICDVRGGSIINSDSSTAVEEKGFGELFRPRWRRITLLLFVVWWGFAICYYGTIIICTRVFENFGDDGDGDGDGDGDEGAMFDYSAILISSSAEVVGTAIAIALVDRIGRVQVLVGSYIGGGIFLFFLCFLVDRVGRSGLILLSFAARACEMIASSTVWILTVEIFSTDIRSTGHSATNAMARIGGFVSPYLVSGHLSFREIAFVMIAVHVLIAFCSSRLPETKGVEMGKADLGESESRSLHRPLPLVEEKGGERMDSEDDWYGIGTELT